MALQQARDVYPVGLLKLENSTPRESPSGPRTSSWLVAFLRLCLNPKMYAPNLWNTQSKVGY